MGKWVEYFAVFHCTLSNEFATVGFDQEIGLIAIEHQALECYHGRQINQGWRHQTATLAFSYRSYTTYLTTSSCGSSMM